VVEPVLLSQLSDDARLGIEPAPETDEVSARHLSSMR